MEGVRQEADLDRRGSGGWPRRRGPHRWTPTLRGCRRAGCRRLGPGSGAGDPGSRGRPGRPAEVAASPGCPSRRPPSVAGLPGPRPRGPQAAPRGDGGAREAGARGSVAACVFLLLLFLIKEEFISYLPPARGRGAAIGVNGAEEYKKISLRRIIKVTSWNINRRVTCKKCNITIFTRTAERGKAIKFNIKIFHSLDNLVNKHGIGTTFLWGMRDTAPGADHTSAEGGVGAGRPWASPASLLPRPPPPENGHEQNF